MVLHHVQVADERHPSGMVVAEVLVVLHHVQVADERHSWKLVVAEVLVVLHHVQVADEKQLEQVLLTPNVGSPSCLNPPVLPNEATRLVVVDVPPSPPFGQCWRPVTSPLEHCFHFSHQATHCAHPHAVSKLPSQPSMKIFLAAVSESPLAAESRRSQVDVESRL